MKSAIADTDIFRTVQQYGSAPVNGPVAAQQWLLNQHETAGCLSKVNIGDGIFFTG